MNSSSCEYFSQKTILFRKKLFDIHCQCVLNFNNPTCKKGLAEICIASIFDMAQSPKRPASNRRQYDTVSKTIIQQNPKDWVVFSLGIPDVEVVRVLETQQPTVKSNQVDSFIHTNIGGKEGIVHLEMQTHDSREVPMPYRIAGYAGRGIEAFQLPLYSHVIYLHPRAGKTDPGEYVQEIAGYEIRIRYKVIRLCELEGSPFLEAGVKGLIPFTPLMKPPPGITGEEWLRRCVEGADAVEQDLVSKADYLTDLAILGGLIFEYSTVREIIMEAIMQESSVIQHFLQQGIEQGIEQGARQMSIESTLTILAERFPDADITTVKPILEAIEDLDRLKQLNLTASIAESFLAFRDRLEA